MRWTACAASSCRRSPKRSRTKRRHFEDQGEASRALASPFLFQIAKSLRTGREFEHGDIERLDADQEREARWDGGRIFGFAVIFVLFGMVLLFGALAFFGTTADGEPAASIELSVVERKAPLS